VYWILGLVGVVMFVALLFYMGRQERRDEARRQPSESDDW